MTGFIAPDFDDTAVPGLPGPLPAGEHMVWQGKPETGLVLRHVFKARWIAAYFAVMVGWLLVTGLYFGRAPVDIAMSVVVMAVAGAMVIGFFWVYSVAIHRTTIYTLTTRRIVMRTGVALPTCFNLPFTEVEAVDVLERADGSGNMALRFKPDIRLSWMVFWPHVRGLRLARPEPQLTGLKDVRAVADQFATQLTAHLARRHSADSLGDMTGHGEPMPLAAE